MTIEKLNMVDLEDRLHKLKQQLDFILRAFAAMSVDETDIGLHPTVNEAFRGMELGQQIAEEMRNIGLTLTEATRQSSAG